MFPPQPEDSACVGFSEVGTSAEGRCPHSPVLCPVALGKQPKSANLTHWKRTETTSLDWRGLNESMIAFTTKTRA